MRVSLVVSSSRLSMRTMLQQSGVQSQHPPTQWNLWPADKAVKCNLQKIGKPSVKKYIYNSYV
jgi:hypothetical protein